MSTPPNPLSGTEPQNVVPSLSEQPAPPAARPSPWRDILQGALEGIRGASQPTKGRGSFAQGVGMGVGGEMQGEQERAELAGRQSAIRFQNAQSADLISQAALRNKQLSKMDQEAEDAHNANAVKIMGELQQMGVGFSVVGRSPEEAQAYLEQETKQNGGVGPKLILHLGDKFVAADLNQATQGPAILPMVNQMRQAQGLQPLSAQQWATMPQAAKNQTADDSAHYFNPVIADEGSLAKARNALSTAQAQPDYPGKEDAVKRLAQAVQLGEANVQKTNAEAAAQAANVEKSRQEAGEPYREKERAFQADLARQTAEINRQNQDKTARGLKADEMITKEANDRDSDLKNINDLKDNLSQIDAKNQAAVSAFQVKFAEHEIVQGGVKRLNTTELDALTKGLGDYGRQFRAWVDKGFNGDMPKATKAEMATILDAEAKSRNALYDSHVANINSNIRGAAAAGSSSSTAPKVGDVKKFPNGRIGKWDGKGWVAQ